MKHLVISFALLFTCSFSSLASSGEKIDLTIGNWKPFIVEDLPGHGPIPQLVKAAFRAGGAEVAFHFLPWKRAMKSAKRGLYHGSFEWGKLPDRVPHFHFCEPYRYEQSVLFFNREHPLNASKVEDLWGKTLASGLGSGLPENIKPHVESGKIKLVSTTSVLEAMSMLARNHVDFVYKSLSVGQAAMAKMTSEENRQKISYQRELGKLWDYRVIISKNRDPEGQLCKAFDKGLSAIKKNGTYKKIVDTLQR